MSIRYRLLFVVGFVSTVVFVFAFLLNKQLIKNNLVKIQKEGNEFFMQSFEKRREQIEQYVYDEISRKLAQINALLETVTLFPSLSDWFAPNSENLRLGTWFHSAYFLQDEDWVQFLQNTSDSKVLSLIVPEEGPFFKTESEPLENGIVWMSIIDSTAYQLPCLGIQLPLKIKEGPSEEEGALIISEGLPLVYVLYTINRLKSIEFSSAFLQDRNDLMFEHSMQGFEIDEDKFYEFLMAAVAIAKNPELKIPENKGFQNKKKEESKNPLLSQKYLEEILDYSGQLFLLGEVTSLQRSQLFSSKAGEILWPDAISSFTKGNEQGNAFFLRTVLGFSKPIFDDQLFFKKHPPKPGSFVSSGSSVIKSPHPNQLFFVNTAVFYAGVGDQKKESFLTIGFDMSDFVNKISAISSSYGCIISGKELLTQVAPATYSPINYELVPELLYKEKALQGFFSIGDSEYFFLKIYPDPAIDLYFCFFSPKEEAFGLYNHVAEKVKTILKNVATLSILLEVFCLLLLWLLLLDLSKKITKPIVALSESLKSVKTRGWDSIKIPATKLQKNNEIDQLVDAFHEMVEGMKEKEKMSGILNKVVSKEIACEILKGGVLLGGEEKVVTMLFADIRGFTQLTQNMEPHDIINLLNTCMTKLSRTIENNKGVIDKFLGDGIMALYGAPVSYKESPLHAVISGMEMMATIRKWDEERVLAGQVPLNIGIGIHTGIVCAGNMGAQNRLNYTVIGSHVNMASRLCLAAEPGEVLITADTYAEPCIYKNIEVEDKGFMTFKGFDQKKQVYKVLKLKDADFERIVVLEGNE